MDINALHPKTFQDFPEMAAFGPGAVGHVLRKTTVNVSPIQGSVFEPNRQSVIQIQFPKNGFLNPANTWLRFHHTIPNFTTPNGNANCQSYAIACRSALSFSGQSWMRQIRLKLGGKIIEDVNDYNVLDKVISQLIYDKDYQDSIVGTAAGFQPSSVKRSVELADAPYAAQHVPDGATPYAPINLNRTGFMSGDTLVGNAAIPDLQIHSRGVLAAGTHLPGIDADSTDFRKEDANHTREQWGRGRTYQCQLHLGIFNILKYLPLRFMPLMEIEIVLDTFRNSHTWLDPTLSLQVAPWNSKAGGINGALWGQGQGARGDVNYVAPHTPEGGVAHTIAVAGQFGALSAEMTYQISNVYFECEYVEFDDSYYAMFDVELAEGITIPFNTYSTNTLQHSSIQRSDFLVSMRFKCIKSVIACIRRQIDLQTPTYDKFMFVPQGMTSYQFRIGTQYFPQQPVNTACDFSINGNDANTANITPAIDRYQTQRLMELTKITNAIGDYSRGMAINVANNKFNYIIGVDLDREYNRLSGIDTTKGLPMMLQLTHNEQYLDYVGVGAGPLGAAKPAILHIICYNTAFLDIFPGEVVEKLE